MNNFYRILAPLFSLLITASLWAEPIVEGYGIVYGEGYSFNIKAPKGWSLDPSAGAQQGIPAVFYPIGKNWSDSPIVAYAQSRKKNAQVKTADDAAKATIERFHAEGHADYQGKRLKTLTTVGGKETVLYQFSGDKYGNSEVAAYFEESDRINVIVMSTNDAKLFAQSLTAFDELAKSYKPLPLKVVLPDKKP